MRWLGEAKATSKRIAEEIRLPERQDNQVAGIRVLLPTKTARLQPARRTPRKINLPLGGSTLLCRWLGFPGHQPNEFELGPNV